MVSIVKLEYLFALGRATVYIFFFTRTVCFSETSAATVKDATDAPQFNIYYITIVYYLLLLLLYRSWAI